MKKISNKEYASFIAEIKQSIIKNRYQARIQFSEEYFDNLISPLPMAELKKVLPEADKLKRLL